MTIPVLICDDSSFARKQVTQALPKHWDADLSYAQNGEEALKLIYQGKADVLFLDLTMPVLDGFGVLEAIRREDLPTLPIVISGDIQPDSARRVKELGSIAFLQKPVQPEALEQILKDYGLLLLSDEKQITVEEGYDFGDWCQELANVAKGQAANLLARAIDNTVELSIPSVTMVEKGELRFTTLATDKDCAVSQGFIGAGIAGEMVQLFNEVDSKAIQNLLYAGEEYSDESDIEAIMDMANILGGAFLKGFCEQVDINFSMGQPSIKTQSDLIQYHRLPAERLSDKILIVDCHYTIAETIKCEQLIMFPESSARALDLRAKALA
ncbi:MAG: response regulator [Candidatus Sedimenticola sp. 20ELBAFRAG]